MTKQIEVIAPTLVILDRDGVINEDSDDYIKSADEWQPIPGSIEAIIELKAKKIPVAIATNQSGVGRGLFDLATLMSMHDKLYGLLAEDKDAIKHIAYCPHAPDMDCICRKPQTGMLDEISLKLDIALNPMVFFVGDSFKDIQAARKANCTPVLVKTGKGLKTLAKHQSELAGVMIFDNLQQFVEAVI
ncbi:MULTISPECIES: D-glycero-beta-D-manno-heptose 1,7-bisphosphate 7-phosphatase [Cysteiniphilum]|uniref:D,D-heptose 1,7-bisphosphate phosphatase n=1 Tax=Cysteiniphilum litorale TaxID=2056700 RepID=A0A8J2Z477_9GAMM|nr:MULTISPECIES: D-glycero-beta-D-manno-heptose 1,7-bisphosphate 7-phosphatase [Cysteiniphilum]GGF96638.1 D-glycero-beta-D-manno-heptose-1,7-bisphosphate 7-phosphatase [Cysteiniphilum litorale]